MVGHELQSATVALGYSQPRVTNRFLQRQNQRGVRIPPPPMIDSGRIDEMTREYPMGVSNQTTTRFLEELVGGGVGDNGLRQVPNTTGNASSPPGRPWIRHEATLLDPGYRGNLPGSGSMDWPSRRSMGWTSRSGASVVPRSDYPPTTIEGVTFDPPLAVSWLQHCYFRTGRLHPRSS